ncbi:hypothetical protein Cal7507_2773 [Calothrix sp. PCC 7507]|nr:hypothetical protein Cal7507_2773 [Calothrix sp. PCC 7507]
MLLAESITQDVFTALNKRASSRPKIMLLAKVPRIFSEVLSLLCRSSLLSVKITNEADSPTLVKAISVVLANNLQLAGQKEYISC